MDLYVHVALKAFHVMVTLCFMCKFNYAHIEIPHRSVVEYARAGLRGYVQLINTHIIEIPHKVDPNKRV